MSYHAPRGKNVLLGTNSTSYTEKKREPIARRDIWWSVTQLSVELHFGANLYIREPFRSKKRFGMALQESRFGWGKNGSPLKNSTKFQTGSPRELWRKKRLSPIKESRFSKLLSKRAILALFLFLSVRKALESGKYSQQILQFEWKRPCCTSSESMG